MLSVVSVCRRDRSKGVFAFVPSGESGKNTVSRTTFPPCDKKVLEDKGFWEEVVADLKELKEIMEPKPVVKSEEEENLFEIGPPDKWWWDAA